MYMCPSHTHTHRQARQLTGTLYCPQAHTACQLSKWGTAYQKLHTLCTSNACNVQEVVHAVHWAQTKVQQQPQTAHMSPAAAHHKGTKRPTEQRSASKGPLLHTCTWPSGLGINLAHQAATEPTHHKPLLFSSLET